MLGKKPAQHTRRCCNLHATLAEMVIASLEITLAELVVAMLSQPGKQYHRCFQIVANCPFGVTLPTQPS